jgi:hypothetical protein
MELLENFTLSLSVEDVLKGEGADPEIIQAGKPSILRAASSALYEGFSKLNPVALIQMTRIVEHRHERILLQGGNELSSPLIARQLAGAEQVVAAICTVGPQLEEFASSKLGENPLLGLALDGLGNAAVGVLGQQVCLHIGKEAQDACMTTSTPISPGEPEWPVEIGQPQIFSMLQSSLAGISLTSGGMMVPKKSISFVLGIGPTMNQSNPCDLCSLRERCRYRHG